MMKNVSKIISTLFFYQVYHHDPLQLYKQLPIDNLHGVPDSALPSVRDDVLCSHVQRGAGHDPCPAIDSHLLRHRLGLPDGTLSEGHTRLPGGMY